MKARRSRATLEGMLRAWLCLAAVLLPAAAAERPFFLRDGDRVLFLGDSITQAGAYVEYIEAALLARLPGRRFEITKLGLSSETVSGLSEPDHPSRRPNLHDRLDRALELTRPTVVVACYGMNDGIYHPFSEERFAAYRDGIDRLAARVRGAGARMVLLTPPMFDPRPKGDTVAGPGAPEYGYKKPYRDYDSVLARYGEWIMTFENAIDVHGPMVRHGGILARDGVHPGAEGHWLMARAVLEAWGLPPASGGAAAAWKPGLALEISCAAPIPREQGGCRLKVTGAPPRVRIYEGATLAGEAAGEDMARGIDLADFEALSAARRAGQVLDLIRKRWQILWPALMGKPALPLEEARRQAGALLEEARALARPAPLAIRLEAAH